MDFGRARGLTIPEATLKLDIARRDRQPGRSIERLPRCALGPTGRAAGESARALTAAEAAAGRFRQRVEPLQITQELELAASVPWVSRRALRLAHPQSVGLVGKKADRARRAWVASRYSDFFPQGRSPTPRRAMRGQKTAVPATAKQAKRSRWLKQGPKRPPDRPR